MIKTKFLTKFASPLQLVLKQSHIFSEFSSNISNNHEKSKPKFLFTSQFPLETPISDSNKDPSSFTLELNSCEDIASILSLFEDKTRAFSRNDKIQAFRAIARLSKAFPFENKEIYRKFSDFITKTLSPELENLNELGNEWSFFIVFK